MAHACCRALVVLLLNRKQHKAKLGAMGVCSCVVEALHLFPSSVQVLSSYHSPPTNLPALN